MLKLFVIEDVAGEPTSVEEFLRNHIAGIPGADHPIRVTSVFVSSLGKLPAWPGPVVAAPGAAPVGGVGAATSGGVGAVASPSLGR
jgi:hypothetical protein